MRISGMAWPIAMRALSRGWDGDNAPPISSAAINTVEALEVTPTHTGGLQVELHCGGLDLEIEVAHNGQVESVLVSRLSAPTDKPEEGK